MASALTVVIYIYDAQGNEIEEDTPEGSIHYGYNSLNQKTAMWTTANSTSTAKITAIDYSYDILGRLTGVNVVDLNGQPVSEMTADAYDADGNKAYELLPNGVKTEYSYDALNRLTGEVETNASGQTLYSVTYTLNPDGTRASATEEQMQTTGQLATITSNWGYDALDRLTSDSVVSSLADENYSDNYSYDLDGNQITKVHTTSAGTDTTTNTYNGDDQLTQSVDSSTGTTTYGYDANGSQTSSTNGGVTTTYTYDVRNRLSSVTTGGVTTTYGYDDDGNRVSETTAGTTTYYLIDSNNPTGYAKPIEVKVGSPTAAPTMSYILGLDVIGQANSSGAVSYLLIDGQDNTRALTNSSGVVTATFNYSAFGSAVGSWSFATAPTDILFQQTMYDVPSGLNIFGDGVREVKPGEDSYIESDSPGYSNNRNPITLNSYLLDNADGINIVDPSGHDGELAELEISETIGETIDADSDVATEQAAKRAATGDIFNVYLGVEPGTKSGGGGIASGGLLPHAFIYVDNRFTHSGMAYDVGGTGVFVDETTLSDVKARPSILLYVTELNLPQYVTWTAETYVLSTVAGNLSKLDENGLISAASTVHFPFSSSIMSFLNPNTVNCYKFTAVAAFSAWVIGL